MFVQDSRVLRHARSVSSQQGSVSGGHPTSTFFSGPSDSSMSGQSSRPQSVYGSTSGLASPSRNSTTQTLQSASAAVQPPAATLSNSRVSPNAPLGQSSVASSSSALSNTVGTQNPLSSNSSSRASTSGTIPSATSIATPYQNQSSGTSTRSSTASNTGTLASDSSRMASASAKASGSATAKPISSTIIAIGASAVGLLLIGIPLIVMAVRRKRRAALNSMSKAISLPSTQPMTNSFCSRSSQNSRAQDSLMSTCRRGLISKPTTRKARDSIESFGPGPRPTSFRGISSQRNSEIGIVEHDDYGVSSDRVGPGFQPGFGSTRGPVFRGKNLANSRPNEDSLIPISYNTPFNGEQTSPDSPYDLPMAPRSIMTPASGAEFNVQRQDGLRTQRQPTRILASVPPPKQVEESPTDYLVNRSSYMSDEFPRTPMSAVLAARRGSAGSLADSQASGIYSSSDGYDSDYHESPHHSGTHLRPAPRPPSLSDPDYPTNYSYYQVAK